MQQSYVFVRGKRYYRIDANDIIKQDTEDDINEFLFGETSIHAKYTKRLAELDKLIASEEYKPGRPAKNK